VILSLSTYLHWVLLTVASAVVVNRAMRPQRQIVFAEDLVIDGEELVIRAKVL
jgi:hypothetical protein